MSERADYIKVIYSELNHSDRLEIVRFINQYEDLTTNERQLLKTELEKTILRSPGPRNANVCPQCGK